MQITSEQLQWMQSILIETDERLIGFEEKTTKTIMLQLKHLYADEDEIKEETEIQRYEIPVKAIESKENMELYQKYTIAKRIIDNYRKHVEQQKQIEAGLIILKEKIFMQSKNNFDNMDIINTSTEIRNAYNELIHVMHYISQNEKYCKDFEDLEKNFLIIF